MDYPGSDGCVNPMELDIRTAGVNTMGLDTSLDLSMGVHEDASAGQRNVDGADAGHRFDQSMNVYEDPAAGQANVHGNFNLPPVTLGQFDLMFNPGFLGENMWDGVDMWAGVVFNENGEAIAPEVGEPDENNNDLNLAYADENQDWALFAQRTLLNDQNMRNENLPHVLADERSHIYAQLSEQALLRQQALDYQEYLINSLQTIVFEADDPSGQALLLESIRAELADGHQTLLQLNQATAISVASLQVSQSRSHFALPGPLYRNLWRLCYVGQPGWTTAPLLELQAHVSDEFRTYMHNGLAGNPHFFEMLPALEPGSGEHSFPLAQVTVAHVQRALFMNPIRGFLTHSHEDYLEDTPAGDAIVQFVRDCFVAKRRHEIWSVNVAEGDHSVPDDATILHTTTVSFPQITEILMTAVRNIIAFRLYQNSSEPCAPGDILSRSFYDSLVSEHRSVTTWTKALLYAMVDVHFQRYPEMPLPAHWMQMIRDKTESAGRRRCDPAFVQNGQLDEDSDVAVVVAGQEFSQILSSFSVDDARHAQEVTAVQHLIPVLIRSRARFRIVQEMVMALDEGMITEQDLGLSLNGLRNCLFGASSDPLDPSIQRSMVDVFDEFTRLVRTIEAI